MSLQPLLTNSYYIGLQTSISSGSANLPQATAIASCNGGEQRDWMTSTPKQEYMCKSTLAVLIGVTELGRSLARQYAFTTQVMGIV